MADFKTALNVVLEQEGGYVNNPSDHGGETYKGISRKQNPLWPGWTFVDRIKQDFANLNELNVNLGSNPVVDSLVESFYQQGYWNFDAIENQVIADKVFSYSVNFGRARGIKILQTSLLYLGYELAVDGNLGPKTIKATNDSNPERLLSQLRVEGVVAHVQIILRDPSQETFLRGWAVRDVS